MNTKTCKTWCFDFEIRVKWWSIGPPPIDSLFLSSAPSPGYQQQQKQRKQPKNNIEILGQKWYRLYNVWFKAHNRTLIYQSHTKLFYVQYHIIRQNMTYVCVTNPGNILQTEIQEGSSYFSSLGAKWNHSKITFEWKLVTLFTYTVKNGLGVL